MTVTVLPAGSGNGAGTGSTGGTGAGQGNLYIQTPADGTIVLVSSSRIAFTITGLYNLKTSSGTVTASVKINGTDVTGLAALSITSATQSPTATALNTVAIGDRVTLVLSASSTPINIEFTMATT